MVERGEAMLLDRFDLLGPELGREIAVQSQHPERPVLLVPTRAPRDLRHLRRGKPPPAPTVELGEPRERHMGDVHVEPHADRVGRDQIVHLAGLIHRHLGVAGAWGEGPHHHRRPAAHPAQHLSDRVDLLGREGDDGRPWRQPRKLGRARIRKGREARPADDLGLREQRPHHRRKRFGAENHRLLPPSCVEHPVGEDMPPLRVGAQLRLVQSDEGEVALHRHALGGAQEPARVTRQDLLFAGDQRHLVGALQLHHPVVDLARQQPQRKADHARGMAAQPLHREMGLSRVGGPKDRRQRRTGERAHRP